ncbi:MFS transporter [Leucobacter sp. UT-8R-CII-1-4]|uniref:MFS transporter n=1 Tax=Leucobacter sp. UT-8R-CII-1-4 TaxID=3040075 RepID=UPI0024AA0190|nr:MFS transporter [Leucobacter sp. UT-8R-CII-1-4]MDI6023554.1 MFS transporter [Leucobacter sp. UT-8R-CII-1-4]
MTKLSPRVRMGYALGGITSGTYGTVPGLILMPFLTDYLGVAAGLAGLIVFAPKAWDFILNPIAGRISDRSQHPSDRRRPFVIRAGALLAIVFVIIFVGPTSPPLLAGLWVLLISLACATIYAFFQVPFLSMAAEITDDYSERTRLTTWRVAVFSIAILVSGAAAPMLVEAAEGITGYRIMAAVMGLLILLGALGLYFGTKGVPLARTEEAGGKLLEQLGIVLKNRDTRDLVIAFVLQAVAIGMVLSGVVYVARHVVHDPSVSTFAFACFVLPAVLFAPLWSKVGVKLGKKRGFMIATVVLSVGLFALLGSRTGDTAMLLIAAAVVGIGYAGAQIFPLAMLPDVAAEDARRSGVNRIGMISGLWSGFELLGLALGPALLGVILSLGGYVEASGSAVLQSAETQWAIVLGVSVVPAVLCVLSLIPLAKYRLDGQLREQALAKG